MQQSPQHPPVIPPSEEVERHQYYHGNYDGQGKSLHQEVHDTRAILAVFLLSALVGAVLIMLGAAFLVLL